MSYEKQIVKEYDNCNEERLKNYNLPIIKSVNQLLEMICFTHEDESKFFYSRNRRTYLYHQYEISKRNGNEKRIIEVPDQRIKEVQQVINKYILSKFNMSDSCHGFHKNRSILTNALPHVGAKTLLKFDIKDFFPSIRLNMVVKQFRFFGYGINVSRYLGYLCVNKNYSLPQGAPTSPLLSNLVCIKIDKRISAFCNKRGYAYTRYADDITISSNSIISKKEFKYIEENIQDILQDPEELYSFRLNKQKSHRIVNGQKMIVTGVVVNDKPSAPRSVYRELDNAIRCIPKYGVLNHLKALELDNNVVLYKQHLIGLACYINVFDKKKGKYYLDEISKLHFE